MAGSGRRPKKETLKNKSMLVVRNITKQEVTNVIFPNGITVGTIDLHNGAKIHGNAQVTGVLNASDVRIDGNPITGTMGPAGPAVTLTPSNVTFPADYNGNIDSSNLSLGNTTIGAILGSEALKVDNSSPFDHATFRVGTPTASGITLGSETQSDGATSVTYSTHNSLTGDTGTITYPVTLSISGSEATVNVQQNFIKSKAPVPTPIVSLTKDLISIPSDYLGRNPSDNQFFNNSSDFPNSAKTTLSVMAGNTSLAWHGDQNSASPSNPPEGKFLIDWHSVTGETENGTSLQYRTHGSWSGSGDKDYYIHVGNASSGQVLALRITEDSSGNPIIDMYKLTEFDDNSSGSTGDGSQRFDVADLTIPIKITLAGATSTVNRSLTISKQKAAQPTSEVNLSNDTITIPANSLGQNPVDNDRWGASSDFVDAQSTDLTVTAGSTSLTWNGDHNSSSPTNPTEGKFLIDWHNVTGASSNGTALQYGGHNDWAGTDDKAYTAWVSNSSSGYVLTFLISENASGNPNIRMKFLGEFDNTSSSGWTGGTVRFDELYVNIPVKVTLGGTTTTITKTLTVSKNKEAAANAQASFSRDTINIDTDYLGRHPTAKKQYANYADSDTSNNVPDTAFTKVEVSQGGTSFTFGGHKDSSDPTAGTYKIDSSNVVIKTIGTESVHPRTLNTTLETTPSGYPDQSQQTTDPTDGATTYDIFGRNSQVVFGLHITSDSNDAKLAVSLLDFTDGTVDGGATSGGSGPGGAFSLQEDTVLFDSVEVTVPIVIAYLEGGTRTVNRTFTVAKSRAAAPAPSITLSPMSVSLPSDSAGTVSDYSPGATQISVKLGTETVPTDNSAPYGINSFRVGTPTGTDITVPSTLTHNTNDVTTNNPSAMGSSADNASISYPVTVNVAGQETTVDVVQSFSKSKQGASASSSGIKQVSLRVAFNVGNNSGSASQTKTSSYTMLWPEKNSVDSSPVYTVPAGSVFTWGNTTGNILNFANTTNWTTHIAIAAGFPTSVGGLSIDERELALFIPQLDDAGTGEILSATGTVSFSAVTSTTDTATSIIPLGAAIYILTAVGGGYDDTSGVSWYPTAMLTPTDTPGQTTWGYPSAHLGDGAGSYTSNPAGLYKVGASAGVGSAILNKGMLSIGVDILNFNLDSSKGDIGEWDTGVIFIDVILTYQT